MAVRAALVMIAAAVLLAQGPPKLGKTQRHPFGFVYALPKNWTAESGSSSLLLLPPGVRVDPGREDNSEVYSVSIEDGFSGPDDPALALELRARYFPAGLRLERDGERAVLSVAGKAGVILTWELRHADRGRAQLVRVYVVERGAKLVSLSATGLRDKVASRDAELRQIALHLDFTP